MGRQILVVLVNCVLVAFALLVAAAVAFIAWAWISSGSGAWRTVEDVILLGGSVCIFLALLRSKALERRLNAIRGTYRRDAVACVLLVVVAVVWFGGAGRLLNLLHEGWISEQPHAWYVRYRDTTEQQGYPDNDSSGADGDWLVSHRPFVSKASCEVYAARHFAHSDSGYTYCVLERVADAAGEAASAP